MTYCSPPRQTLLTIARDRRHLRAGIGFFDRQKQRLITVSAEEFIRRFLMHAASRFPAHPLLWLFANCHRRRRLAIILPLLQTVN